MWRTVPRLTWAVGAVVALATLAGNQVGAAGPLGKKRATAPPPKAEETVGDLASVFKGGEITVEGVGLVAGLENTGGDIPPSWFRTQLVDEMSKAGVEHASELIQNKQFAPVIVRMKIPTGAAPKDRFDVEVVLPPASAAKSLAGGYLMTTRLREVLVAGGTPRTGSDMAMAMGPVMTGSAQNPGDLKSGRVLGAGRVKKDYPYKLLLGENKRSIRNAGLMEKVVNERFHQNEKGQQKGAATAKSDSNLVLKVPDIYHQNQERFFRVVQLLPMIDTPALREQRMAGAAKELLDPKTSGVAALKLEALGPSASEALGAGLKHADPEVRFFAAEALAYLDDAAGVEMLGQTAITHKQFRAYALAALAAMEDDSARIKLRKLLDQPEMEVRYGAFNALRTLDEHDAALGQVKILDDPYKDEEIDPEAPDAMALAIASARRPRPEDPFALYIVETEGPPVVHVSRSRRSEIVVFGRGQKLQTPIVLGSGPVLLNAALNDDELDISKIVPSKFGDADVKVRSSLEIGEVIRHVANMGSTYPEVIAILEAAQKQKNLPGPLFVDSVPVSTVEYFEKSILGATTPKKDAAVQKTASGSRLRKMFNFRDRSSAEDDGKPASAAAKSPKSETSKTDAKDKPAETGKADDDAKDKPDVSDKTDAKTDASDKPAAKKDDSLQKTGGAAKSDDDSTSTSRFRFLDRLRGRGE
ncbi:flagellar basal body P-ring protein FlgI [Paludisphaera borealis]|uniref:Flagellar P-ring protein n=1 Tax=Paludisphaera borealis TaxID=1387353 RepID=A0A1U7CQE6_9BACT|nr:flagellar basal body P-ring protein FlgI [Paludisphaera borealis]APW61165.1 Flagellar P-ring protein [Paludisphaera borealis]